MKILDISSYNEKLKINPVNLDDFDKINAHCVFNSYKKEDLQTGDLCMIRTNEEIGVVILKHTIDLQIYDLDGHNDSSIIIFPQRSFWSYIYLSGYGDNLKFISDSQFDILKVAPSIVDFDTLEDEKLLRFKFENEYKRIFNI